MNKIANRIMRVIVVLGCFLAAIKMLHTGFTADEEYQLVMDYRLASGDRLFGEVWDTIQTSGFLGALFIRIFLTVTGSTEGILLYLRLVGILLQGAVAVFLYITLRKHISEKAAFFIGATFFISFSKMVVIPDFSNMQGWFLTACICILWHACDSYASGKNRKGILLIILSALLVCGAILSTACIIVVPAIMLLLWFMHRDRRWERELAFLFSCMVTGIIYLMTVVGNVGADTFFSNIMNIITGDDTHMTDINIVGDNKLMSNLSNLTLIFAYMAVTGLAALFITTLIRRKQKAKYEKRSLFFLVYSLLALAVTLWQWFVMDTGFDGMKLYIPVLFVCGFVCVIQERFQQQYFIPAFAMAVSFLTFLNILFISNVPLVNNLAFLIPSAIWGIVALAMFCESSEKRCNIAILEIALCLVSIIGTGYTMQSSGAGNNVFGLNGIIRIGPAKGVITAKDVAYVYYTDYNEFQAVVEEGSNVLIVTDFFRNTSITSCYMLNDVNISHYTVNSTPTYSAKLEEYWTLYPDRAPDVIVINKTVVTMSETDWIYSYLYEKFGYSRVYNGAYLDYYYKE